MKYSAVVTFCYFCAELTLSPFLKRSLKIFTYLKSVKIIFTKKGTKLINFSTAVTKRGIVMLNI